MKIWRLSPKGVRLGTEPNSDDIRTNPGDSRDVKMTLQLFTRSLNRIDLIIENQSPHSKWNKKVDSRWCCQAVQRAWKRFLTSLSVPNQRCKAVRELPLAWSDFKFSLVWFMSEWKITLSKIDVALIPSRHSGANVPTTVLDLILLHRTENIFGSH